MVRTRPVKRTRRSIPQTLPSPIGGLNNRDGLANMPPTDAFVMDNWFPNLTTVDTRLGSVNFLTGAPAAIESLEVYTGPAGSKMLAFTNGAVYDISSGALGTAKATGKNSNKISSTMFSNAGGAVLIGLTGNDAPFSYDGTTYTALTLTGVTGTPNTLHCVHGFKGRLYFAQKDQLGFYYLGVGNIQGAASYFDLGQQMKRGGYLAGIASFSQESEGQGPNDYIVFMSSEGEYVMYAGTDPSSAANWQLVGRYYGPAPIGRKGWFNYRSDLYLVTEEGVISFTEVRQSGEDGEDVQYLTSKLGRAYTDNRAFSGTHGWCATLYPRSQMLVVNVPTSPSSSGTYVQFVMNTNTKAWCRFTGWNGLAFCVFNKRLYFATTDGRVVLADEGLADNGGQILADCRQAYNYFDDGNGSGAADKIFHFGVFMMQSDGAPPISAQLNTNFEDDSPNYTSTLAGSAGAAWDVTDWDTSFWAGGVGTTQTVPFTFNRAGFAGSIWLRYASTGTQLRWFATRVIYEKSKTLIVL